MSTENNETEVSIDATPDLDTFSDELFGRSSPPEEATSEEVEETEVDDAPTNDTQEADTLDNEEEIEEEAPAPKKTRFQERIDELTAGKREAERKAQELSDRLEALESKQTPTPKAEAVAETEGPDPYAKNEDGSDVYPLGEFDPGYLKAYTKHILAEEREAAKREDTQRAEQAKIEAERRTLQETWETKLEPARERYPDFQEKGQELISSFDGIDPAYGEYISSQIMDLDYGPDVLYYLANHPDEAKAIVESGARKATVSLAKLDAKFSFAEEEKQTARPKVSQAPTPPPTNKGAAPVTSADPNTDDLDAFTRILYKKR